MLDMLCLRMCIRILDLI